MCDIYHFPEDKVACEYLAYLNQKKIPINRSPTIEILEGFENECLKVLVLKKNEKQKGPIIYNSLNLPQPTTYRETSEDDDDDGDLNSYYGASDRIPARSKQAKREASPNEKEFANKKRLGKPDSDTSGCNSPANNLYKGKLFGSTPKTVCSTIIQQLGPISICMDNTDVFAFLFLIIFLTRYRYLEHTVFPKSKIFV